MMALPLFYNTSVQAKASTTADALPLSPEAGSAKVLSEWLLKHVRAHTVRDLLTWHVSKSGSQRYRFKSREELTTAVLAHMPYTRGARAKAAKLHTGTVQRQLDS